MWLGTSERCSQQPYILDKSIQYRDEARVEGCKSEK